MTFDLPPAARRHRRAWRVALSLLAGVVSSAELARATDAPPERQLGAPLPDTLEGSGSGDGVYGRYDGALALAVGPGLEIAPASGAVRPTATAALRFYQSVGLGLAFAQSVATTDPLERSVAMTVVLEPLFLLRWSRDAEWGHAFWDLTVDSLSVSVGAAFVEPRGGSFGDSAGFRLGLGAGIPLLCRANGPWLRFGGRLETGDAAGVLGSVFANLEWQWFFRNEKPE